MKKHLTVFAIIIFALSSCEPWHHDTLTIVNQSETELDFTTILSDRVFLGNGQWKDTTIIENHNVPIGGNWIVYDGEGFGSSMGQDGIPWALRATYDTIFCDGITLGKNLYDAENWDVVTNISTIGKGGSTNAQFIVTQQDIR